MAGLRGVHSQGVLRNVLVRAHSVSSGCGLVRLGVTYHVVLSAVPGNLLTLVASYVGANIIYLAVFFHLGEHTVPTLWRNQARNNLLCDVLRRCSE